MKGFPEELIYVLMFGAVLLLQYLMKRLGPLEEEPPPPLEEADPELPAPPPAPVFRAAADVQFGRAGSPGAPPALAARRFSRKALMGNRREVQNAIVIAAILGPCRAFEPHDIR